MKQVVTLRGTTNAARRLDMIEARHRELDSRLRELGRSSYLTAHEEREAFVWLLEQAKALIEHAVTHGEEMLNKDGN